MWLRLLYLFSFCFTFLFVDEAKVYRMIAVKQGISVEIGEFPIKGGKRSVKMSDGFPERARIRLFVNNCLLLPAYMLSGAGKPDNFPKPFQIHKHNRN